MSTRTSVRIATGVDELLPPQSTTPGGVSSGRARIAGVGPRDLPEGAALPSGSFPLAAATAALVDLALRAGITVDP